MLFGKDRGRVLTSATLAHHGEFEVPARALGTPIKSGLIVDGAFHYQSQGRLVIPKFSGDPRDDQSHAERIARYLETRIKEPIGILVLFTSWRLCFHVQELLEEGVEKSLWFRVKSLWRSFSRA